MNFHKANHIFFIGVAGTGMSALAQYCKGIGKKVSGSDRYFNQNDIGETQQMLIDYGIECFAQDASGITSSIDLIVISTAVEESNIEIQQACLLNIPIIKRSELLNEISSTKKTIAVGGTSGKSTTTAMIFDILEFSGLEPSIISGAGLIRLQEKGLIGNAFVGKGEWLVIEADESDGSIVYYKPVIGLLLNIDKDHKEIEELFSIFQTFKNNSQKFIVNAHQKATLQFSQNNNYDFSVAESNVGFCATDFVQEGFEMKFNINNVPFQMKCIGAHNMENALAAVATSALCGVGLETSAQALKNYKGIYRRNQILGNKNDVIVIDDYAHNPAKCAAAIKGVQPLTNKVVAWFQPHGYGPTKFLRHDFVDEISKVLRKQDEIWMSEIFYAGGTAIKDISANDLINDLNKKNCKAFFVEDRNNFINEVKSHLEKNTVLLLMGARDPSLADFAQQVFEEL
ncbi:MAG: UDP-N-acetylmuramate--alanine ligase [Chitinophagaceae bacterium]|nr:UDP-N-acetylmuramate--alanine ligase [Chitinophagaceae bacterium]